MSSEPACSEPRSLAEVTIRLSDSERETVRQECIKRASVWHAAPLDDEELLTEAELTGSLLPDRVLRALHQFRRYGNRSGALLLRNMPVDRDVPATPGNGYLAHWNLLPVATFAQLVVTSMVGDVIAYADEKAGRPVQDIVPLRGAETRQENSGTVYLELHTEDGFHPHKPDFITLLCLRPDHARVGQTLVGAVLAVLPRLSRESVATLRLPLYRLKVSSSFGGGRELMTPPVPVLSGTAAAPEVLADFHGMEPIDERARRALAELREALLPALRGAVLDTGDLIVVDNRTAVHGRTPFAARFDGTDRWLRRCFAVSDIRRSQGDRSPGSRVCRPLTTIGFAYREDPACTTSSARA